MKLPRALLPLYLTTLLDVLGFTLMIPLLPAFVKHYGAANIVVGALLSLPAVFSMISAPLWGATSDRAGRKAIILISQAFSLAGYLLLALANSLWLIFASRVIIGFGAGNMGVAQSYVADVTNPQQRERAYALFGALYGAGFLIGPILGAQLLHFGLSAPFYFAAAVELVAIGLTWVFLNAGREKVPHSEVRLGEALRNAGLPGVMRTYARQFLFIFSVTYFLGSFALYLDHALHYDVRETSWMLASAGAIGGLVLLFAVTPLEAKVGENRALQIGFALGCAAYIMLCFVHDTGMLLAVLALWAIAASITQPTLLAVLAKIAPDKERGAIMGLNDSVNSVAILFGPPIGSLVAGLDARWMGVLPALALFVAFLLGTRGRARSSA